MLFSPSTATTHQNATIEFVDKKSIEIFSRKEYALIGMSPNNSYYNEQRMEQIITWVLQQDFKKINVFLADEISAYNWLHKGKNEKDALKRTREEDNKQRNRLFRVLEKLNLSKDILLKMSDIAKMDGYQKLLQYYLELFDKNPNLKEAVRKIIYREDAVSSYSLDYFLHEMPIIFNLSSIVGSSCCVFYHRLEEAIVYLFNELKIQHEN